METNQIDNYFNRLKDQKGPRSHVYLIEIKSKAILKELCVFLLNK